MKIALVPLLVALAASATPVQAGPATDSLVRCLSDSTNGRERKDLAKWIFAGMAAHPEIRSVTTLAPRVTEDAQKQAGAIFSRLLGTACLKEMQAVVRADGQAGAQQAFEFLGKVAMQELMTDAAVTAALGGFEQYVDKAAMAAAFSPP